MDSIAAYAIYIFLKAFDLIGMHSVVNLFGVDGYSCVGIEDAIPSITCRGLVGYGYILLILIGVFGFVAWKRMKKQDS